MWMRAIKDTAEAHHQATRKAIVVNRLATAFRSHDMINLFHRSSRQKVPSHKVQGPVAGTQENGFYIYHIGMEWGICSVG